MPGEITYTATLQQVAAWRGNDRKPPVAVCNGSLYEGRINCFVQQHISIGQALPGNRYQPAGYLGMDLLQKKKAEGKHKKFHGGYFTTKELVEAHA